MSGYDSPATSQYGQQLPSKRRRVPVPTGQNDIDWTPQPTTARAKANARAAQQHSQHNQQYYYPPPAQDHYSHPQQHHPSQHHPSHSHHQQQPKVPVLSLASLPPAALQRYLSRYGLLTPTASLSYHHAVFPCPALPATLHPPLDRDTRSLNFRTAKLTYDPARRNARIVAGEKEREREREAARGREEGEGGEKEGEKRETELEKEEVGENRGVKRKWVEPRMHEFMGLRAFDPPEKVLERLAARATAHWEKRDTIKEAETLTNFMFSCRSRGHTLRATPAG